jgi:hypothetical protein
MGFFYLLSPKEALSREGLFVLFYQPDIAVLKRGEVWGRVLCLCPMPYALCPMPYEHLMLLRKAIFTQSASQFVLLLHHSFLRYRAIHLSG